jgi:hypothetical protein
MNYQFERDVILEFKRGRVVNSDMTATLDKLLAEGYVSAVPDEVYLKDGGDVEDYLRWNGVRLDKLKTIASFREAFDALGIFYSKYWRIEDFRAASKKYIAKAWQYRTDVKRKQIGKPRQKRKDG